MKFNQFISSKVTGVIEDYYSRLSVKDFEEIKTTLKDLHNIITYKTTIRFIEWVSERFLICEGELSDLLRSSIGSKPNVNGYDVMIFGEINIIAEIMCNKPFNNQWLQVRIGAEN